MHRLGWGLYRALRRLLLPGMCARDRLEMDELIARRLAAARHRRAGASDGASHARGLSAARIWGGELLDLLRVWRRRWRLPTFGFSWIDVKLGLRMVVKQPGLTAVAILALGVGIPVGMAPSQAISAVEAPLPVDEGDRVRTLVYWNVAESAGRRPTEYDYARWREELSSFSLLGAARMVSFNLDSDLGFAEPIAGAAVTASVFDMLRVPPALGRSLHAEDERGDTQVVVLGHELWTTRFGADPAILGRRISISGAPRTVVGVMPEGFLFPSRHQLWVPLPSSTVGTPGDGMSLTVVGRLADGVSVDAANREIEGWGRRMEIESPPTHALLRPAVRPTFYMVFDFPVGGLRSTPDFYIAQLVSLLLLGVASANVGMLMFARTANRSVELAVRTALGASRGRIVLQVFTESLVLAVAAAGVGLLLIDWLPRRLLDAAGITSFLPYWIDPGVTPGAAARALALAVFSAAVASVVPALRVTGHAVQANIQRARARHVGRRFGGVSTVLIVADVAVAVMVVGVGVGLTDMVKKTWDGREGVGIAADEFLAVQLRLPNWVDDDASEEAREAFATRLAATQTELVRRLSTEPGVRGVAVASALPRMDHSNYEVEIDGAETLPGGAMRRAHSATVDIGFFDALRQPIRSGRGFDLADLGDGVSVAIVNTNFVEHLLEGRNPIGKRFRHRYYGATSWSEWREIIGVVDALGMNALQPVEDEGFYLPAAPGEIYPVRMGIHVGDDPAAFLPRLREIAGEVDPTLALRSPMPLHRVFQGDWYILAGVILGAGALVGVLLMMAASGLYAILSFTVAQRTHELGVRTALGASRGDIALAVAKRSLLQIAAGVLLGLPLAARVFYEVAGKSSDATLWAVAGALALGVGIMILIALAACTAPTLRALRILPTEALRAD